MQERTRLLGSFFVCPAIQGPFLLLLPQAARRVMQVHFHQVEPFHVSTVLLEDGLVLVLERAHLALLEPILLRPVPHQVRLA